MNLDVPINIEGVDSKLLNPINNWKDHTSYKMYEDRLVSQFKDNFNKFNVSQEIVEAGPK